MKRHTLSELQAMPTIEQGHTDDLKRDFFSLVEPHTKVWLSRLTKEDGMPHDNMVAIEQFDGTHWTITDVYEAK